MKLTLLPFAHTLQLRFCILNRIAMNDREAQAKQGKNDIHIYYLHHNVHILGVLFTSSVRIRTTLFQAMTVTTSNKRMV